MSNTESNKHQNVYETIIKGLYDEKIITEEQRDKLLLEYTVSVFEYSRCSNAIRRWLGLEVNEEIYVLVRMCNK